LNVFLSDADHTELARGVICRPQAEVTEIAKEIYYVTRALKKLRRITPPP
jgi:hypothetical protein